MKKLLSIVLLFASSFCFSQMHERDSLALRAIFLANPNNTLSWSLDSLSRSFGISLGDRVQELILNNKGIDSLPPQVAFLDSLNYIELGGSNLKYLPNEIGQLGNNSRKIQIYIGNAPINSLPDGFFDLNRLEALYIDSLPNFTFPNADYSKLSSLISLSIKNNLKKIPSAVYEMKNLEELTLEYNSISNVSDSIRNLKKLQYILLGNNQIKTFPKLNIDGKLHDLDLSSNLISDLDQQSLKDFINVHLDSISGSINLGSNISLIPQDSTILRAIGSGKIILGGNPISTLPSNLINRIGCNSRHFRNASIKRINWGDDFSCEESSKVKLDLNGNTESNIFLCFKKSEEELKKEVWIRTGNFEFNYFDTLTNKWVLPSVVLVPNCTDTTVIDEALYIHPSVSRKNDSLALVALYNANPNNTLEWNLANPINTWSGVTVRNGMVISLSIFNEKISSIPDEIKLLNSLKSLTLVDSSFLAFPTIISDIPNLQYLTFGSGSISELPVEISNLKRLKSLNLSENRLVQLPIQISELDSLEELALSDNNFTDVPDALIGIKNLKGLYLDKNNLKKLNGNLGELSKLTKLDISYNPLDSLPQVVGELPNLIELNLAQLNFKKFPEKTFEIIANNPKPLHSTFESGVLEEFPNSKKTIDMLFWESGGLKDELDLSANNIATIGSNSLKNIECRALDVMYNNINRINYGNASLLCGLSNLNFEGNKSNTIKACYNIPEEDLKGSLSIILNQQSNYYDTITNKWVLPNVILVPNCTDTTVISEQSLIKEYRRIDSLALVAMRDANPTSVFSWDFTKPMEEWNVTTGSYIQRVELENNRVTKLVFTNSSLTNLPLEIGNLNKLKELFLNGNSLSNLPSTFSNLDSLNYLNLSLNNFKSFPQIIVDLKKLETLQLNKNQITALPTFIGSDKLQNLRQFSIVQNNISEIPKSIGSLKGLRDLGISHNKISSLPVEIEQLDSLTGIDLSDNQFTIFPHSITKLTNLIGFGISGNNISTIPDEIGNLKKMTDLQIHNNKLTSLPISIGDMSNLLTFEAESNFLTEFPTEMVLKILSHNNRTGINLAHNLIENFPDNKEIVDLHLGKKLPVGMAINDNNIRVIKSNFFEYSECDSITFTAQNIERINLGNTHNCSTEFWKFNLVRNKSDSINICFNGSYEALKNSFKLNVNGNINFFDESLKQWQIPNVRLVANCTDTTVIGKNRAPFAETINDTLPKGKNELEIDLSKIAYDIDNEPLSYSIVSDVFKGRLELNGSVIKYSLDSTLTQELEWIEAFHYKVCDLSNVCDQGSIDLYAYADSISLMRAPVISEIYSSSRQRKKVLIDLFDNANDENGDTMVVSISKLSNTQGEFIRHTDPMFIEYTPSCNIGLDSLQYIVCDTFNLCDTSYIIINVFRNYNLPYLNIKGTVYEDLNSNNVFDSGEEISGVRVNNKSGRNGYSKYDGSYTIYRNECEVSQLQPSSKYKRVCNASQYVISKPLDSVKTISGDSNIVNVNFKMEIPEDPCVTISGQFFNDINNNGIKDAGELELSNTRIILNNGSRKRTIYTNYKGEYSFNAIKGELIDMQPLYYNRNYWCSNSGNYEVSSPKAGYYNFTVTKDTANLNFGIHIPTPPAFDVSFAALRAGRSYRANKNFRVYMDYKVQGDIPGNCEIKITHDTVVKFNSSAIEATNLTFETIEWNNRTTAFRRSSNCMAMNFKYQALPVQETVKQIVWKAELTCPDACPNNNSITRTVTLRNGNSNFKKAAEPVNTMEVYHRDSIKPFISQSDSVFSYVIDFQNTTGHNAVHMAIIDTLSEHIDITSLSSPFSSQPYKLYIKDGNLLHFEFENINLPDSSNDELNSYGFVQFNVKMKPNLPEGTVIENKASVVYNYEYNSPIQLRKVQNKLGEPTGINDASELTKFSIHPNPSNGTFTIDTDEKELNIQVYNSIGKLLLIQNSKVIDLTNQPSGVYNIRINGLGHKVIKQ